MVYTEEVQKLLKDIAFLKETIENKIKILSVQQLNWKPDGKSWSIAECLEHLQNTDIAYIPTLDKALAEARNQGINKKGAHSSTFFGKLFIKWMKPGSNIKLKAPKIFAPKSSKHNSGVIQDYLDTITKFESYIINFDGFDFNKIKIKSVVNSLLRLNIGDFFEAMIQHHYRHHAQIERVLNHPQFPKD